MRGRDAMGGFLMKNERKPSGHEYVLLQQTGQSPLNDMVNPLNDMVKAKQGLLFCLVNAGGGN